jgi:hypothetical protein
MGRERAHRFCQPVAQILSTAVACQIHEDDEARVVRPTSVAMAERLPVPMNKAPSQSPDTDLPITSAGLSRDMTMSG